jgi:hypothetical protein
LLASCSLDSYTFIWDLRKKPSNPVNSFSSWNQGIYLVKHNMNNMWLLATAQQDSVWIWDIRKGSIPMLTLPKINHGSRISALDWHPMNENLLLSGNLDGHITVYDMNHVDATPHNIKTNSSIVKSKFSPFGLGIISMSSKSLKNLDFWAFDQADSPSAHVHSPYSLLDFEITARMVQNSFQTRAVGWTREGSLVNFPVSFTEPNQLAMHEIVEKSPSGSGKFIDSPGFNMRQVDEKHNGTMFSRMSSFYQPMEPNARLEIDSFPTQEGFSKSSRDLMKYVGEGTFQDLRQELKFVMEQYPDIVFETIDMTARRCVLCILGPWSDGKTPEYLRMNMVFPTAYPRKEGPSPKISVEDVSPTLKTMLNQALTSIAERNFERKRTCIESCIRFLKGYGKQGSADETISPLDHSLVNSGRDTVSKLLPLCEQEDNLALYGNRDTDADTIDSEVAPFRDEDALENGLVELTRDYDQCVPFPRLSAVAWSPLGKAAFFFPHFPFSPGNIPRSYDLYDTFKEQVILTGKPDFQIDDQEDLEEEDLLISNLYFPRVHMNFINCILLCYPNY